MIPLSYSTQKGKAPPHMIMTKNVDKKSGNSLMTFFEFLMQLQKSYDFFNLTISTFSNSRNIRGDEFP